MEFLRSIPGTVGGFVRMNGGAYGREVSDVLIDCEASQADALARRGTMTQQMEAQTSLRDSARVAYTLSEARFRAGVDSFLTTLDSQRTLYTAEQSLLATLLTRATNMVELYRAMGGGLK